MRRLNMKLPSRSKAYMIPEYSLTGDLLSFLTCAPFKACSKMVWRVYPWSNGGSIYPMETEKNRVSMGLA